jgi:glutamate 5-kinase
VRHKGKSLLPIGVLRVTGVFRKGDVVALSNAEGEEFARGLTNYSSEDSIRICGLRSDQISQVLGTQPYEEVVHRDNLVVII